jgi:hypothetical protein
MIENTIPDRQKLVVKKYESNYGFELLCSRSRDYEMLTIAEDLCDKWRVVRDSPTF